MGRQQATRIRNNRFQYAKISKLTKLTFLRHFFSTTEKEKISLKKISKLYNLNYSTAKTLIRKYKQKPFTLDLTRIIQNQFFEPISNKLKKYKSLKRCSYRIIDMEEKMCFDNGQDQENQNLTRERENQGKIDNAYRVNPIKIVSRIIFPQMVTNLKYEEYQSNECEKIC